MTRLPLLKIQISPWHEALEFWAGSADASAAVSRRREGAPEKGGSRDPLAGVPVALSPKLSFVVRRAVAIFDGSLFFVFSFGRWEDWQR